MRRWTTCRWTSRRSTTPRHEGTDGHPGRYPAGELHAELRALIAASGQRLAGAVNAELTRLYWTVGQRLASEVWAASAPATTPTCWTNSAKQLAQEFGRGFESRNLRRMVKFAQAFLDTAIVSTLSTQLSWSHLVAIVALKSPEARAFYAQRAAQEGWSVRELSHQIKRKAFERTEIAASRTHAFHHIRAIFRTRVSANLVAGGWRTADTRKRRLHRLSPSAAERPFVQASELARPTRYCPSAWGGGRRRRSVRSRWSSAGGLAVSAIKPTFAPTHGGARSVSNAKDSCRPCCHRADSDRERPVPFGLSGSWRP